MDPASLKPLHRELAYLVSMGTKPTEAMRRLRPDSKRPDVMASKLMRRPDVQECVAYLKSNALEAASITTAQIARELGRIAFLDPRKLFDADGNLRPLEQLDDDTAAAIAGIDVEELFSGRGEERTQTGVAKRVKLWNKREALADLAAIAGMKRDQVAPPPIGPGFVVQIIQSNDVRDDGNGRVLNYVAVNLPPPQS